MTRPNDARRRCLRWLCAPSLAFGLTACAVSPTSAPQVSRHSDPEDDEPEDRPAEHPPVERHSALRRHAAHQPGEGGLVPFSRSLPDGGLPHGWHPYRLRRDKHWTHYDTTEDRGRTVVRAHTRQGATGLRCPVSMDPSVHRRLRFSWSCDHLPPDADATDGRTDDSPARVIVAFGGDTGRLSWRDQLFYEQVELWTGQTLPYATLMYVWDAATPVETLTPYERSRRIQYLTVESGPDRLGQWLHYERDLVADYRRAFGENPGPITSVGILTDSDDLHTSVTTLYGDIFIDAMPLTATQPSTPEAG